MVEALLTGNIPRHLARPIAEMIWPTLAGFGVGSASLIIVTPFWMRDFAVLTLADGALPTCDRARRTYFIPGGTVVVLVE